MIRTGEIAADAAWPAKDQPPNPPVAMMNVYNGSARPPRDVAEAWNRPVLMGFESAVDRAFAGGPAGAIDGNYSASSYDEWRYARDRGHWCCAADSNSVPAWALANIEEYAFQYATTIRLRGYFGPILWYGNNAAVDAAVRGTQRAGLVGLRWKVGTWGNGEGGGPHQPPFAADAELLQSGNTPGPLAVPSDHNWLYERVAVFAAMFGPSETTPIEPPPAPGDDMEIYASPTRVMAAAQGAWLDDFDGAAPRPFGIPNDALEFAQANAIPKTSIHTSLTEAQYDRLLAGLQHSVLLGAIAAAGDGGGGDQGTSGPTEAQRAAAVGAADAMTAVSSSLAAAADQLRAAFA